MNAKDLNASPGRGGFDRVGFAMAAIVGSLASLAITGFVFGINNNTFHLPIIGALYDEPQFAQDAFVQSLRFYASGLWLLLRGADRFVDPYWLFLGLDYLSRLLAFAGFLACADLLGVRGRKELALFAGLLCLTALLRGYSFAGAGGLFINYFTRSEIANGLTLISLYFAARARLTAAFGFNGAVFFVNAFIALWNALPLGMIVVYLLLTQQIDWRRALIDGAAGLLVFFALAAAVLWNILSNPEFGVRTDFDIVAFYNQYFPYHFLFDSLPLREKLAAAAVVLVAVSSFVGLAATAQPFLVAMFGYLAVYVLGIVASYFAHNAIMFNLTLLRVSTMFHLLAALGSLALAIRWLSSKDPIHARVLAPVLVVLLCTSSSKYLLLLAPLVILVSLFPGASRLVPSQLTSSRFRLDYAAGICVAVAAVTFALVSHRENQEIATSVSEWTALGKWARANPPINAIFLLPVNYHLPAEEQSKPFQSSQERAAMSGASIFEHASHRQVWVDRKRGAAVMRTPSYYRVWWPRVSETLSLTSHPDRMAYAQQKAIDYVLELCPPVRDAPPLFTTGRLCLYSVPATAEDSAKG